MDKDNERRREKRLHYYWPIWFAEDFTDILSQGQMADVSSKAAAFTCYPDNCPYLGQQITARFSIPRYGADGSFDLANFTRSGCVTRVDELDKFLRRVAIQFAESLPFRPGEQSDDEAETDSQGNLEVATIVG